MGYYGLLFRAVLQIVLLLFFGLFYLQICSYLENSRFFSHQPKKFSCPRSQC